MKQTKVDEDREMGITTEKYIVFDDDDDVIKHNLSSIRKDKKKTNKKN